MMTASARTHAGRVRPHNEDAAVCRPEHGLFAVIDGMGGQEAGEVAAAIAAAALAEVPNLPRLASETVLAAAMKEARARILRQAEAEPGQKDMGAVATAVRLDDNGRTLAVAHVGDTRAWIVNAKGVRQLTHDHVAEREAGGANKRPVARDLGRKVMEGEWVETGRYPIARGDLLVLASDGLHDAVPADELAAELQRLWREGGEADAVSARLIALALARGGPDNVTVIAVRIGRFRRGRIQRRLGLAVTIALFVAMAGLAGVTLFGRRIPAVVQLPDRVTVDTLFGTTPNVQVEAGKTTTVTAGARLEVRGTEVRGIDWRVEVSEGATFAVHLATIELDGALTVLLAEGATLEIRDSRVKAGSVRVVSTGGGRVVLANVWIDTPGGTPPAFEGPVVAEQTNVVLLGAPAPAGDAQAPAGDAPAPGGDVPAEDTPGAPAGDTPAPTGDAPALPAGDTPSGGAPKP
ncbi:MAG: protein phosphatase 2C domain-containing protein [Pseudomonadota bacterium]|nr:protein phosphatase 2C domain-containing protein [Pseudomonadota bacterium]